MNRKQPLLLALSAAMVIGTSAPAFAAEATDAATREDVISLLWQQEGAPSSIMLAFYGRCRYCGRCRSLGGGSQNRQRLR